MKKSLKGVLFSGLVYPGLGQIVLKHISRGVLLLLVFSACLLAIIVEAVHHALTILEKIASEGGAIDMATISKVAAGSLSTSDVLTFKLLMIVALVCWIFGIFDAYGIGRKMDIDSLLEERNEQQKGS